MRSKGEVTRKKKRRQAAEAEGSSSRKEDHSRSRKNKKARREESSTHSRKKDDRWKGFGDFLKEDREPKKKVRIKEHREDRDADHRRSRKTFEHAAHRGDSAKRSGPSLKMGSPKMLDKHIRRAMKMPVPPKNPFVALMEPMVIVPDNREDKMVIADAGSILRLMNQATLYRDWISPVTHRADELLVQYGKPGALKFGWITNKQDPKIMKPSKGPTFLVNTRKDSSLIPWELFRLKIGQARKKDPMMWLAPWIVTYGPKLPRELREVTKFFGGKPIKNEPFDDRCMRLFTLILHTELDMASAKKGTKKGKGKKSKDSAEKTSKKSKSSKKDKSGKKKSKSGSKKEASSEKSASKDDYVIKRLVKENPRRAGSAKAKIWDKLKKGMTIGEFVEKGGSRASVGRYVENGWVKLLRPGA